MPRIRSIKPDFWKSESIAIHSFRARLTFIGLWTYVDDNGVGLDNPKLIAAELFALEDDPRETLANVREDLARLADTGRITRYEVAGKHYLAITGWSEHQKIDRPGKPRYPEPDHPDATLLTCGNAATDQRFASPSRDSRETLDGPSRLEQGAGSREEGAGSREEGTRAASQRTHLTVADDDPDFAEFWSAYPRRDSKGDARKAWPNALKKAGNADVIIKGAARYRDWPNREQRYTKLPATWLNQECWADELVTAGRKVANGNGHQPYRDPEDLRRYDEEF